MSTIESPDLRLESLSQWFLERGQPFLATWDRERAEALKHELAAAGRKFQAGSRELPICFLGKAGVGKSTLINALVDPIEAVVPQGGIGPLTAQATVVRWAERPFLHAKYHNSQRINQLSFALDAFYRSRAKRGPTFDITDVDPAAAAEAQFALPAIDGDEDDRTANEERIKSYLGQARQLVTGTQFRDANVDELEEVAYLADALRAAMGRSPNYGHRPKPEHAEYVQELLYALAAADTGLRMDQESGHARHELLKEVARHATGSVAPLIKHLEVGWDSPTLPRGVTLVDLPGVGVANDEYRWVTSSWIRRASAVALVVDRSGVTEPEAELLHTSGFLNALLHRDPSSDSVSPLLWIVTVKLDDVARDDRNAFRQTSPGRTVPSTTEFFADACRRSEQVRRDQLTQLLEAIVADPTDEQRRAQRTTLANMQVYGVSAAQYRKLQRNDDDDPPWIKNAEQSNIPQLLSDLTRLSERHEAAVAKEIEASVGDVASSIDRGLQAVLEELTRSDRERARITSLVPAFDAFVRPLASELEARRTALTESLLASVPKVIDKEVAKAIRSSSKRVEEYLGALRTRHWSTLRATVRRGGAYLKDKNGGRKNIDIPNELALRYEAQLAVVWNRAVVTQLKAEFVIFENEITRALETVLAWTSRPEVNLDPAQIKRYRDDVHHALAQLSKVVEEMTDRLRDEVKTRLHETVQESVRAHCQTFVEERRDVGAGVSTRVVLLLKELGNEASEAARATASDFLKTTYTSAVHDLMQQFATLGEPISRVRSLLFTQSGAKTDGAGEARRKQQLDSTRALRAELRARFSVAVA